ncbi:MAG TPA: helix-turn-helix transcriptional regulator [Candidatus Acidoferrales bacterium]|jgi:DNA-binding transcriptional ArsR family regulator|nr:helix-turn-helix transcriptional regulator [Candidatus Acidoferrales bacterium]
MSAKSRSLRSADPGLSYVAALIGEPARAAMLCALLDEGERPAGELALLGAVAANAASAHLAKLVAGGLIVARTQGRQRLFRLSGPNVARALEGLLAIAPPPKIVALSQSRTVGDLRAARSCYDHLAGQLGVAVTDALVERAVLVPEMQTYRLTPRGAGFFASLDIDVEPLRSERRHFARQCLDWSERRPHLAGALGCALRGAFLQRGWVTRRPAGRVLRVTPAGHEWLGATLSIDLNGD